MRLQTDFDGMDVRMDDSFYLFCLDAKNAGKKCQEHRALKAYKLYYGK